MSISKSILRSVRAPGRSVYPLGRTNTDLARRLGASPATVSSVTNRLFKAGKLSRHTLPKSASLPGYRGGWLYY